MNNRSYPYRNSYKHYYDSNIKNIHKDYINQKKQTKLNALLYKINQLQIFYNNNNDNHPPIINVNDHNSINSLWYNIYRSLLSLFSNNSDEYLNSGFVHKYLNLFYSNHVNHVNHVNNFNNSNSSSEYMNFTPDKGFNTNFDIYMKNSTNIVFLLILTRKSDTNNMSSTKNELLDFLLKDLIQSSVLSIQNSIINEYLLILLINCICNTGYQLNSLELINLCKIFDNLINLDFYESGLCKAEIYMKFVKESTILSSNNQVLYYGINIIGNHIQAINIHLFTENNSVLSPNSSDLNRYNANSETSRRNLFISRSSKENLILFYSEFLLLLDKNRISSNIQLSIPLLITLLNNLNQLKLFENSLNLLKEYENVIFSESEFYNNLSSIPIVMETLNGNKQFDLTLKLYDSLLHYNRKSLSLAKIDEFPAIFLNTLKAVTYSLKSIIYSISLDYSQLNELLLMNPIIHRISDIYNELQMNNFHQLIFPQHKVWFLIYNEITLNYTVFLNEFDEILKSKYCYPILRDNPGILVSLLRFSLYSLRLQNSTLKIRFHTNLSKVIQIINTNTKNNHSNNDNKKYTQQRYNWFNHPNIQILLDESNKYLNFMKSVNSEESLKIY